MAATTPPKKIVLLNPPLSDQERSGALAKATGRSLPYGLLSVAAVTRKAGYQTRFMDAWSWAKTPLAEKSRMATAIMPARLVTSGRLLVLLMIRSMP